MTQTLFELNVPEYITHVKLSEHRRAKHYQAGDTIPAKYSHPTYCFNKSGKLVDTATQTPVVKNPRVAGTPSWKKINGQEFYKGTSNTIMRSKVIGAMKEFFRPYFDGIPALAPEQMPVTVELELHDNPIDEFDIDNLAWVYTKVILDIMTEKKIIPDDNVNFVAKSGGCQFVRTNPGQLRQLVIIVSKNSINGVN